MTPENRQPRSRYVRFAAAWIGFLAVLSCLPRNDKHVLHTSGRFHDTGHFLAFLGLAYLTSRAVRTTPQRLATLAGCLAFAAMIELSQGLFYHVGIEWLDVLIDWVGGLTGGTIGWVAHRHAVSATDVILLDTADSSDKRY